jgi:drug/metabolite transporter (DMT)-like permease
MSLFFTIIILGAALLHAAWNTLLRSTSDRLWGMLVLNIACPLIALPMVLFFPLPDPAAWPYILLSAFFVAGYNIFLVKAYEHGELSQVYPVARGISPLLVTLGALLIIGEVPGTKALIGIGLISFGIIALAEIKHHTNRRAFLAALVTGCFIAAYTVTDGIGGRLSHSTVAYNGWRSLFCTTIIVLTYFRNYQTMRIDLRSSETQKAMGAAVIGLLGYAIIIWAMTKNQMGMVSALRETSVIFATGFGVFFLKERLNPRRLVACALIVAGAFCLH